MEQRTAFTHLFPLFYHQWQVQKPQWLHHRAAETEQWVKWIYFSIIWWDLSNGRGVFSLQSIKRQSAHHGSLSSVDSSSFPIIWDGKSPFCLSWDWKATMAVLWVRMVQNALHTIRTHSESGLNTQLPLSCRTWVQKVEISLGFWIYWGILVEIRPCIWQSETKLSSVSLMGLEM